MSCTCGEPTSCRGDDSKAIVEIAPDFVVVHTPEGERSVVPRVGDPRAVAASIDARIDDGAVVIDVPGGMDGATRLSGELAHVLRLRGVSVLVADDRRVLRAARDRPVGQAPHGQTHPAPCRRPRRGRAGGGRAGRGGSRVRRRRVPRRRHRHGWSRAALPSRCPRTGPPNASTPAPVRLGCRCFRRGSRTTRSSSPSPRGRSRSPLRPRCCDAHSVSSRTGSSWSSPLPPVAPTRTSSPTARSAPSTTSTGPCCSIGECGSPSGASTRRTARRLNGSAMRPFDRQGR